MRNFIAMRTAILLCVGGFLGGVASHLLWCRSGESHGAGVRVESSGLRLVGPDGRLTADLSAPAGSGSVLNLYTETGELRLQLGTYDGSYGRSEKGLPLIGLSDNSSRLRLLFRLAGKNESPVLVFKDSQGRDRMVMGLALSDSGEEPFVAALDRDGKKQLLLGRY